MIPETTRLAGPFAGDDTTTVFPFTFVVFSGDDVKVTQSTDGVETVLTSGYTVSVNADQDADPGGDVTLTTALPTGDILAISGGTAYSQTLELPDGGNFSPASLNRALDRIVMQVQQLKEILDRTSATSVTDGVNPTLPSPVADAFLAWSSTADELVNVTGLASAPVSSAMEPVVAASTLALARTAMGAAGSGAVTSSELTMSTGRVLWRTTAGTGAIEEGTAAQLAAFLQAELGALLLPRGYIDGLILSTAGSSTTFSVAAGQTVDATGAALLTLASALSKTTGAWAVGTGNGALDTGTIANSTWYHVYLIRRPDTGVVDVLVSLSATSPTMPGGGAYTQKRRLGSLRTNGSGQWTAFQQVQDFFQWDAAVADVALNNPGTAAVTQALTVPTGVVVEAVFNGGVRNLGSAVAGNVYFSPLSKSNEAAAENASPLWSAGAYVQAAAAGARASYTGQRVWTNTSAQIRYRLSASDGNVSLYIATLGWIDPRGANA